MEWTAERRSRAAFFALNGLALLPPLLPGLAVPALAAYLIAMALGAYFTVSRSGGDACQDLPVLLVLDLWAFLCGRLPDLGRQFHLPGLPSLFWLGAAAAGLALSYSLLRERFWSRWLARTGAAAALFLSVWDGPALFPLLLLTGAAVLWQTARDLAEHADPDARKRDETLAALAYYPVLFLICFETRFLETALPRWYDLACSLCGAFLRGPWAAVPPALLLFAALASFDRDRAGMRLDTFVLLSALGFQLLLTVCAVRPFARFWLFPAAYWFLTVRSARNTAAGTRFLRMEPRVWLAVQFAAFLTAVLLVRRGLYGNLLVSGGAAAALYAVTGTARRTGRPFRPDREGTLFWMILLLVLFAETAAWICVRRLCGENLAALGTLAAASFLTLWVLGVRHGHPVPWRWRAAVCGAAALCCLGLTIRHGVRAEAAFDGDTVRLRVEAREGSGSISAVSYQWKTWGGDRAEVSFTEEELELPVRGERLVVDAVDDKGVRTVTTFWTPWTFPEDGE